MPQAQKARETRHCKSAPDKLVNDITLKLPERECRSMEKNPWQCPLLLVLKLRKERLTCTTHRIEAIQSQLHLTLQ